MFANQQLRCETGQPVKVTLLEAGRLECIGEAASLSGRVMRLLLDRAVPPGAALKVEWDDTLVLGEVCHCGPAGDRYSVGLMLEHSLLHIQTTGLPGADTTGTNTRSERTDSGSNLSRSKWIGPSFRS